MKLNKHHYVLFVLVLVVIFRIAPFDFKTTNTFRPRNWAEMSIAVGASILALVGIITSIVVSNENNQRGQFVDELTNIMDKLRERASINADRSLTQIYDNSVQKMSETIDERLPLKYSDGIIGIISFFCFLLSALSALENITFKWVYGLFLTGVALLVGYVVYCILEFEKIDRFSRLPEMEGNLTLLSVRINGEAIPFNSDREPVIAIPRRIRRLEFGVRFEGQVRNGFFHAVIRYRNGQSTHIPEPNTYLGDTVFAEGRILVISPDKRLDTGILQSNGPVELLFDVCRDISENPQIGETEISGLGRRGIHRYCSIPEDYILESIELRVFEDPLFKSNYKRREIDLITVRPERS